MLVALLNHFQENTAFWIYFKYIDNDVLSSFAVFCQKGDNIDRFGRVKSLYKTGFCNYKLSLWHLRMPQEVLMSLPQDLSHPYSINGNKGLLSVISASNV